MGRGKVEMEYMTDPKKRTKTYKTRKQCLLNKLHEITTLCDVKACAIIYDESSDKPEVWPPNREEDVRQLIRKYRGQAGKTYTLSDFYKGKKRKIEDDLSRVRKKNRETKYPTWDESLNKLKGPELREFAARLENKLVSVKSRIAELKKAGKSDAAGLSLMNQEQQGCGVFTTRAFDTCVLPHGYNYYYSSAYVDQQQNQLSAVNQINAPSTMTMLTSGCKSDQGLYESSFGQNQPTPNQINTSSMMAMLTSDCNSDQQLYESILGQNQSVANQIDGSSMMATLMSDCNSDQGLYESIFGQVTVEPTVCNTQGRIGPYNNGLPMLPPTTCYVQQPPEWLQFLPRENFAAQGSC